MDFEALLYAVGDGVAAITINRPESANAMLARELAAGSPLAFRTVKTLLNGTFDTFDQTLKAQMEQEARAIVEVGATANGQEGINAFLNKRKPEFKGA